MLAAVAVKRTETSMMRIDQLSPPDPAAQTMGAMVALACRWKGANEFLADAEDRLSGSETLEAIARVAGGLAELGIGKGSVVTFLCGSSVRHTVAFFACQWLGAIGCALHVRDTPARLAKAIDWLEADALLFDDDLENTATAISEQCDRSIQLVNFGNETAADAVISFAGLRAADPIPMADVGPGDPATIILSSGTTGEPKGVVHLNRTLFAASRMCQAVYGATEPEDSMIVVMAPSFAAWVITVLPHIAARARIVFGRSFDPAGFLETLSRERITMAPLVPTMWRMILAAEPRRFDLSHLRTVFYSGEPGTPDLVADLAAQLCPGVRTGYMSSEANCASAIVAGPATLLTAGKAASTGRPVPGADLRVVDPDGDVHAAQPAGEVGEILMRSPSIASHYWKDPDRTEEKFVHGWWRSGDLGYLDEDGDLFVVGRTDNVINTGGIKVHAEEVEAALSQHPGVAMAAVVGAPDETWGQRIEAHVVRSDTALSEDALLAYCMSSAGLARIKLPKRVIFVDALPTGPTGKLYRRGLLE